MERSQVVFCIRYAVNVLERHCSFWRKMNYLISFLSLLSGMTAISAVISMNQSLSIAFGAIFAIGQAIEFSIRPEQISAKSFVAIAAYKSIEAISDKLGDDELISAYKKASADDAVVVSNLFRRIAYNDTGRQLGADESCFFVETFTHRFIGAVT